MAAYDTTLTGSATYDGSTIPADSILYHDDGQDNTAATQGSHDGSGNASTLTDSNQSWTVDEWIGYVVQNITDSSSGSVTDSNGTTVTATLSGGTDNDWDVGDDYLIEHATILKDSTKSWDDDEWIDFKVRNVTDGSTGVITDNDSTTITVGSLSGGTNNAWRIGDFYEIIVNIANNDKIYYRPTATGTVTKSFPCQIYDDSEGTYSDVFTVTIETDGVVSLTEGGTVSVSVTGVPSITVIQEAEEASTQNPGGWFWSEYEQTRSRKQREEHLRILKKKEAEKIQSEIDRALALAERELEEKEAKQQELEEIRRLAETVKESHKQFLNERLAFVAQEAIERHTYSAMERLKRELEKHREEEEAFFITSIDLLLNQ